MKGANNPKPATIPFLWNRLFFGPTGLVTSRMRLVGGDQHFPRPRLLYFEDAGRGAG
jgi:hypothetical protein